MKYFVFWDKQAKLKQNTTEAQVNLNKIAKSPQDLTKLRSEQAEIYNSSYDIALHSAKEKSKEHGVYLVGFENNNDNEYKEVYWVQDEKVEKLSMPEKRFYIFDRDDTLTDKNNKLINENSIVAFLKTINKNHPWAIASAGAIDLHEDWAYQALSKKIKFEPEPAYVQFNGSLSLIRASSGFKNIECQWDDKTEKDPLFNAHLLIVDAVIDFARKNKVESGTRISVPKTSSSFSLNQESILQFTFGKTIIEINALKFCEHLKEIEAGKYKIFYILNVLDQKGYRLDLTQELKDFGIVGISAPEDYISIAPKDVVFVDDRPENCENCAKLGITAIVADPPETQATYRYENVNTYLEKLTETLPEDKKKLFLQETTIKEQVNNAVNQYLQWMDQHAKGIRGLTRFSHWHHGDSGKRRAVELAKIVNDPESDLETIIHAINKTIHASSNTKHALSRYLIAEFNNDTIINFEKYTDAEFKSTKQKFKI